MKTETVLTREVDALANVHWHGREVGEVMKGLIREAIRGGADVLGPQPNTEKSLITATQVLEYVGSAKAYCLPSPDTRLTFLPFVMLTEETTREELVNCKIAGISDGKIYPRLRTTKSANGVRHYGRILPVVRWCGEIGIRVHNHFEHPNMIHGNRDAEYLCLAVAEMFLEETGAVIFWEHTSDARCIPAWKYFAGKYPGRFFVTVTAHHLAWNEDQAFGNVRLICKPPLKTERDRLALVQLVCDGHPWVMAGADDAAHDVNAKHVHDGKCACGAFTTPFLHQIYAHALSKLLETAGGTRTYINFTSRNARKIHGLPPASRVIALVNKPFRIPPSCQIGPWTVESAGAGETIDWSMVPEKPAAS